MSNLQSGAVPRFSGSLDFSPEGTWSRGSGVAGFAFPPAGWRGAAQLVPAPMGGFEPVQLWPSQSFPGCVSPQLHTR